MDESQAFALDPNLNSLGGDMQLVFRRILEYLAYACGCANKLGTATLIDAQCCGDSGYERYSVCVSLGIDRVALHRLNDIQQLGRSGIVAVTDIVVVALADGHLALNIGLAGPARERGG